MPLKRCLALVSFLVKKFDLFNYKLPKCSAPAILILSTMSCNLSHALKSQLNYNFDYIGPPNWNSLPDTVPLAPSVPTFRKSLKNVISFWQAFFSSIDTRFPFGCISWIMTYFVIYDYSIKVNY